MLNFHIHNGIWLLSTLIFEKNVHYLWQATMISPKTIWFSFESIFIEIIKLSIGNCGKKFWKIQSVLFLMFTSFVEIDPAFLTPKPHRPRAYEISALSTKSYEMGIIANKNEFDMAINQQIKKIWINFGRGVDQMFLKNRIIKILGFFFIFFARL